MKSLLKLFITLLLSSHFIIAYADDDEIPKVLIEGVAVTGTNRLFGKPTTDYGPPLGTAGFYNMGIYNPNGNTPLLVDEQSPDDALIATAVDPNFLMMVGLPLSLIDESLLNIPLQNVPVNISPAGDQRSQLPSTLMVDPTSPNQAEPIKAITLKSWLKAKGLAKLKCGEHKNSVDIKLHDLIPNRLYSMWGIFESADAMLLAVPLGGVPNAVTTNNKGDAEFSRQIGFCPFERTVSGARLLAIDVVYHSDHQMYGVVPELPLIGLITGSVTHTQLEFVLVGKSLID